MVASRHSGLNQNGIRALQAALFSRYTSRSGTSRGRYQGSNFLRSESCRCRVANIEVPFETCHKRALGILNVPSSLRPFHSVQSSVVAKFEPNIKPVSKLVAYHRRRIDRCLT